MRVIPLTSILSHMGRGSRSLNRDDTLGLEDKGHFKPALECAFPSPPALTRADQLASNYPGFWNLERLTWNLLSYVI